MKTINVAELLKDCPKGMELYSTIYGTVYFEGVRNTGNAVLIDVKTSCNTEVQFYPDGKFNTYYSDSEITLFPSKDVRNWEGFVPPCKFKVGDIVQYITDDTDKRKIMEIDTLCNKYHTDSYSIRFEVEDDWKLVSNKFDINILKHFERVLVRNCSTDEWDIDFFGYYNRGLYHTTGKGLFKQCIPYKNNEHMVGTSIDCDDFYKNWED